MPSRNRLTAIAAILAGVLYFAGQGGELVFGNDLNALWVTLGVLGIFSFLVAIWGLGSLVATRAGRIGWRMAMVGGAFLGLFAVQAAITVAATGDVPENFALFALGFLLVLVGQLLIAPGLRWAVGRAWVLPLVATAGLIAALAVELSVIHDGGLFVFEAAWVALGIALLRRAAREETGSRPVVQPREAL